MAEQKSPHTQTQQDMQAAPTDVNADRSQQNAPDASEYEEMYGAQTGGKRSSKTMPQSANPHNTEDQKVAYEGTLASRSFDDDTKQGVTTAPSSKEAEGQRKVVGQRADAQAGVNHSDKVPPR